MNEVNREKAVADGDLERFLLSRGKATGQRFKGIQNVVSLQRNTEHPLSLEALREMVKRELPGSIYRCKGVVYAAETPDRRAVLQIVGRRTDIALDEEWGGRTPRTQIVAIGAPGSIDAEDLTERFNACLSDKGAN